MTVCHIPSCPTSGKNLVYGWEQGQYVAVRVCDPHQEEWLETRCTCPAGATHRAGCAVLTGRAEEDAA